MASAFTSGDRVRDREADDPDSDEAVVLGTPDASIADWEIEDTEQTVADYNPTYPADDPVILVAFVPALTAATWDWEGTPPDELLAGAKTHDIQRYAYPASRLRLVVDRPTVRAWFDGLCEPVNPGGHGACGVIVECDGERVHEAARFLGSSDDDETMTNNVAEYTAVITALEYIATEYPDADATLFGDSQLIIRQLTGQYAVRSARLRPLWQRARSLLDDLDVTLEWIPREENEQADALSREAYHEHVTEPANEKRRQRARTEGMEIEQVGTRRFRVKHSYVVDLDDESCTCPDYEHRELPCKHIYAVKQTRDEVYPESDSDQDPTP